MRLARLRAGRRAAKEDLVALPSRVEAVARARLIEGHIEAFAAARAGDPLVWAQMPRLVAVADTRMGTRHRVPDEPDRANIARWAGEIDEDKLRARAPSEAVIGEGCLAVGSADNYRRAQAPLRSGWRALNPLSADIRPSADRTRRLAADAVALADELLACIRAREIAIPVRAGYLYKGLLRTAWWLGYWEELLARESLRVVVVSSSRATRVRALLHVARDAGVPTVFIPPSPRRVDVHRTGDLPWDYVGLRGVLERDFLVDHGADRERLDVVGNFTLASEPPPEIDARLAPVFAAGMEDASRLAPLVKVIHRALGDHVTVGRHPASDRVGHYPSQWQVHDGRTYELLRVGPPVVIQHSSGVALEAMHLGIQVVELCYPGLEPLYPFAREPHVHFASTAQELHAAVSTARARAVRADSRRELIEWSRGWASPTGPQAAERMVALVERALVEGPRGRILDTWASSCIG